MVFGKCNFSAAVTSKDKSTLIGEQLSCDPVILKSPFLKTKAILRCINMQFIITYIRTFKISNKTEDYLMKSNCYISANLQLKQ